MSRNSDEAFALRLLQDSYAAYCYFVHKGKWKDTRFHKFLANKIQEFVETETGNPYDILVLSTPPQHGKSLTVTETFPSWYVGKYPDRRCIVAGYNDDFAGKFGRRNKAKLEEYAPFIFGITLSKSSDRDIEIAEHSGSIITRGIMSGITGNSGDLIVIDDPIKNRLEADSPTYRKRLWEEWENSILTRTQAGTKIIIIQTRWHEDDLAGRVTRTEKNIEVVNIPVEAMEGDLLGRKPGEALCPEIGKGDKWLREFKERYKEGKRAWNALYMGMPASEEGNIFKRDWWQFYDKLPDRMPFIGISVDAAFKGSEDSDYVAIEVWGKNGADWYLIDIIKRKMDFPETLKAIEYISEEYPERHSILIEDKANGPAIIAMLRHKISGIIPITPKDSKVARANAVSGIVEAGNVYLPRYADFTDDFIEECASFPNGVHDDAVDAFTQIINKFKFSSAEERGEKKAKSFEEQLSDYKKKVLKDAGRGSGRRKSYF